MKHFAGSATSGMHEGYTAALRAAAVQRIRSVALGRPTHGLRHIAVIEPPLQQRPQRLVSEVLQT